MFKFLIIGLFILSFANLLLIILRRMDERDELEVVYCYKCRKFLTFDSLHAEHIKNHHQEGETEDEQKTV